MLWIGLLVAVVVVWVIWTSVTAQSSEELEAQIAENDALIAETQSSLSRDSNRQRIGLVADIEFDYRDARGNDSHRHVNVEAVDREYFQGYCHKANDTRTFVIGRVRGKVIDLETGEVFAPKAWAAEARQHPLNAPEMISNELGKVESPLDETDDGANLVVEVCFTGFPKERRANLEEMAEAGGFTVRKSVTVGLNYLIAGANAGPAKLHQAAEVGASVINELEFVALVT